LLDVCAAAQLNSAATYSVENAATLVELALADPSNLW
jgi:hypothetical protein